MAGASPKSPLRPYKVDMSGPPIKYGVVAGAQ
jgi:hypothetical protein